MDNSNRDWLSEAIAIVEGKSMLLPQKEHLIALYERADSYLRILISLFDKLAVCLEETTTELTNLTKESTNE